MNKNTRKNIVSAIITLFILLVGLLIYQRLSGMKESTVTNQVKKKERRKVEVSTYTPASMENSLEIDGRLQAHEVVNITSKVTGVMKEGGRSVKEGMYFKKGALLFDIDDQEASYNLKALKSNLLTTITQMMPDLKFDYPDSYDHWQQYLLAFDIDQPIQSLPEPVSDQEKFYVSGKSIYNTYYNIKSQETRLQDYSLYAPFSGVVTAVNVYPGALISTGTVLATMINTSYYEMESPVSLDALKYIRPGQSVTLTSLELDKSWKGKVNRIGTRIDPNTQNIPVYITANGTGLKDGMYVKGTLSGSQLDSVIALPKRIFINPNSVYIVHDSTLIEKQVIPVKRTDNSVIVRGLSSDELVVNSALAGLYTGQKVNYSIIPQK